MHSDLIFLSHIV